ncbi:MAG TPA: peroxiredoxin-like family protein [Terriglobales bacterium]|nr:peroxiredoxin-like family protein [Terriglobales bacterium]
MKWRSLEESTPGADTRSLGKILAERKKLIEQYVPAETQAVHARVVSELRARALALNSLPVGTKAPRFTLLDHSGHTISSSDLLARGRLVLCFFRGRWDPFCCGQLEALNRILPQIETSLASLVALSPQTVKQSFFMADQHRLQFRLLNDAGNRVARQFGLVYRVPEEQQTIYRRAFINLPLVNGDESWELPVPATYIFERDGTVLYASVHEDYTERPEPAEILEALRCGRPPL